MKRVLQVLAVLWAVGLVGWAVARAQGWIGGEAPEASSREPALLRGTKSDAGEGARAKPEVGRAYPGGPLPHEIQHPPYVPPPGSEAAPAPTGAETAPAAPVVVTPAERPPAERAPAANRPVPDAPAPAPVLLPATKSGGVWTPEPEPAAEPLLPATKSGMLPRPRQEPAQEQAPAQQQVQQQERQAPK